MSKKIKLCIDCKNCVPVEGMQDNRFIKCAKFIDVTNGEPENYCTIERAFIWGRCGRRAKYWEAKADE